MNLGMSLKDAALRIAQERDCAFVDADDDATVDNNWYATNNGLGSLDVPRSAGKCVGGTLGESAELLAKGEERKLLTAFFWIVQKTARKKQGDVHVLGGAQLASESNNFLYVKNIPCV
jgi:hypothetical protein